VTEKPYRQLERVAACLKRDGLSAEAERLLALHEGIFNGTELYMAWAAGLRDILRLENISGATRLEAQRVCDIVQAALQ
jgi:hypothetical protein